MKNDELASLGIQAFQGGDYEAAIEFLAELIQRQPGLWTCRLYLAMAYQYAGNETKARDELGTIGQWTTDQTIKKKALDALRALNAMRPVPVRQTSKNAASSSA